VGVLPDDAVIWIVDMKSNARKSRKLDDALVMTFPASDPPAIGEPTGTEPPRRPIERKAPLITGDQIEAALGKVHRSPKQGGKPDPNAPREPVPNVKGKNRSRSSTQKGHGGEGFSKGYGGSGGKGTGKSGPDEQD
jgi:hypothetical protein